MMRKPPVLSVSLMSERWNCPTGVSAILPLIGVSCARAGAPNGSVSRRAAEALSANLFMATSLFLISGKAPPPPPARGQAAGLRGWALRVTQNSRPCSGESAADQSSVDVAWSEKAPPRHSRLIGALIRQPPETARVFVR